MASILDVVNGISQAISAKHHGGAQIGLKRETEDLLQGCSIYDPRMMDGFGVQYQGDMLILKYHSEMPLTSVHDKNFETDIRQTMKDIKKFLEKEYKKVTKKSLDLTEFGDTNILVQSANRRTSYVNAVQTYKIGGIEGNKFEAKAPEHENYSDIAKRWLMNCRKPKTYLKENADVQEEGILSKALTGAALAGAMFSPMTAKAEPTSADTTKQQVLKKELTPQQREQAKEILQNNNHKKVLRGYLLDFDSDNPKDLKYAKKLQLNLDSNVIDDTLLTLALGIPSMSQQQYNRLLKIGGAEVRDYTATNK